MKLSELKNLVVGQYIWCADNDIDIGLDGHYSIKDLQNIIKYIENYKEGNEYL